MLFYFCFIDRRYSEEMQPEQENRVRENDACMTSFIIFSLVLFRQK